MSSSEYGIFLNDRYLAHTRACRARFVSAGTGRYALSKVGAYQSNNIRRSTRGDNQNEVTIDTAWKPLLAALRGESLKRKEAAFVCCNFAL